MTHRAPQIFALALLLAAPAFAVPARAQTSEPRISAAPAGDAARIALHAIHENFSADVCPRIAEAQRLANGSIHAVCDTRETFRVFEIGGRVVAMRCAAAARFGIEGC